MDTVYSWIYCTTYLFDTLSDLQSCMCRISLGDPSSAQAVAMAEEKNVVPKPVAQCALILFIVI
jgi:hypothetical protein